MPRNCAHEVEVPPVTRRWYHYLLLDGSRATQEDTGSNGAEPAVDNWKNAAVVEAEEGTEPHDVSVGVRVLVVDRREWRWHWYCCRWTPVDHSCDWEKLH